MGKKKKWKHTWQRKNERLESRIQGHCFLGKLAAIAHKRNRRNRRLLENGGRKVTLGRGVVFKKGKKYEAISEVSPQSLCKHC